MQIDGMETGILCFSDPTLSERTVRERLVPGPEGERFSPLVEEAVALVRAESTPRVVWRRCFLGHSNNGVTAFRGAAKQVELGFLEVPEAFQGAREAFFLAGTLGNMPEGWGDGNALREFFLHGAAALLLELVVRNVWKTLGDHLVREDRRLSVPVAPGESSGWPVERQHALGEILSLQTIGVWLQPSGMLVPIFSCTAAAAILPCEGNALPGYDDRRNACATCGGRKSCPWRYSPEARG